MSVSVRLLYARIQAHTGMHGEGRMNDAPSAHASGPMVPGTEWSWGTRRGPGPPADLPSGASPQEGVDVREFGCG